MMLFDARVWAQAGKQPRSLLSSHVRAASRCCELVRVIGKGLREFGDSAQSSWEPGGATVGSGTGCTTTARHSLSRAA